MIGKVNYVDFLANLVISLTCLGIHLYGTRQIARAKNEPALRQRLLFSLLRWHSLLAAIGCLFFAGFLYMHPRYHQEPFLIALGITYILSNVLAADWYLQGMESFRFMAVRNIILRVAGLAAIFLLLHGAEHYRIYYAIIALTQLATLFINIFYISPSLRRSGPPEKFSIQFPVLFYFFIASTFISIYDFTDTVMLGWLANDEQVGYYTTAMKLVRLSLSLVIVINTILFPRFSWFEAEEKKQEALHLLGRSLNFIFTIAVPSMALFILLAPELIEVFAGKAFSPSIAVIQWLSPLPLLITLSNLFLMYYLSKFSKARWIWWMVSLALLLNLSLNFLLIPILSEQGAAIASLCTETFIMGVFFVMLKIKMEWKPFIQATLVSSLFIPVVLLVRTFEWGALASLISSLVAAGLVYALGQWLWKNETVMSIIRFLRG